MQYLKELALLFNVKSETKFIAGQSDPKANRFVFSYTITIENHSQQPCQLISRHWMIQDANHKVEEVYGEGVIGEQPLIAPQESYQYTSGAVLETELGTMEGRYFMLHQPDELDNHEFEILIPRFTLSIPRTVH